jgi:hypothetical protein
MLLLESPMCQPRALPSTCTAGGLSVAGWATVPLALGYTLPMGQPHRPVSCPSAGCCVSTRCWCHVPVDTHLSFFRFSSKRNRSLLAIVLLEGEIVACLLSCCGSLAPQLGGLSSDGDLL